MNYQTASEIDYLHELYSQPPAIVAACNRVNAQIARRIKVAADNARIAQEWQTHRVWKEGLWGGALVAVIALAIGWWVR